MGLLIVRGGALLSFFLVFTIPSPSLTLLLFESTFFHMPVLYVPWGLGGGGGEKFLYLSCFGRCHEMAYGFGGEKSYPVRYRGT